MNTEILRRPMLQSICFCLLFLQLDNAKKIAYGATVSMIVTTVALDIILAIRMGLGIFGK